MKVRIKEKEVQLKLSFRAYITFEEIANKTFNPSTLKDMLLFFYCVVISSDRTIVMDFDEFVDWLDDNPQALNEFTTFLTKTVDFQKGLYTDTKKKVTKGKAKE